MWGSVRCSKDFPFFFFLDFLFRKTCITRCWLLNSLIKFLLHPTLFSILLTQFLQLVLGFLSVLFKMISILINIEACDFTILKTGFLHRSVSWLPPYSPIVGYTTSSQRVLSALPVSAQPLLEIKDTPIRLSFHC